MWKNFALLSSTLCIALGLIEGFLALVHPVAYMRPPEDRVDPDWTGLLHRPSNAPGLLYELAPNRTATLEGVTYASNEHGMRRSSPLSPIGEHTCNVLALGDSFTFGLGVDEPDTYPAVLERLLNEARPNETVQVLNLGVSGYGTRDEAAALMHAADAWSPRLVLIGYYFNDSENEPLQPLRAFFSERQWWQRFNLGRLAKHHVDAARRQFHGGGDYLRYLHAPNGEKWQGLLRALDDIGTWADETGVPVVIVIFPVLKNAPWSTYEYGPLHDQVTAAASDRGFVAVDLLEAFSVHTQADLMIEPSDGHPNRIGHERAAAALATAIETQDLLDCDN